MSSQIDHLLDESRKFPPSDEFVADTIDDPALYERAKADREGFWGDQARELLTWSKPFTQVLDWSNPPFAKWFDDGELNVAYNCLDRHVEAGLGDRVAIHWEGEPGDSRSITYAELTDEVKRTANVLAAVITGTYSDRVINESLSAGALECLFKSEARELFLARLGSLARAVQDRKSVDAERRRLQSILSSVGDGVYGVDGRGTIQFINPAALDMLDRIDTLNRERRQEASESGQAFIAIEVGIGINTGPCVVGNMGSDLRFDYSVLGDSVNLASRLEGQCKTYGLPIVVGAATAEAAKDQFALIEIDFITVKGKKEPEVVYAVLGRDDMRTSDRFQRLSALTQRLLSCYRGRDWVSALAAIVEARTCDGEGRLATLFDLYAGRIQAFQASPPPDESPMRKSSFAGPS